LLICYPQFGFFSALIACIARDRLKQNDTQEYRVAIRCVPRANKPNNNTVTSTGINEVMERELLAVWLLVRTACNLSAVSPVAQ
jgi:hypothetical protein